MIARCFDLNSYSDSAGGRHTRCFNPVGCKKAVRPAIDFPSVVLAAAAKKSVESGWHDANETVQKDVARRSLRLPWLVGRCLTRSGHGHYGKGFGSHDG